MTKRTYEEETALIEELEANVPDLVEGKHLYSSDNTPYHVAVTAIKDAYWRRRMLSAPPGVCAPG